MKRRPKTQMEKMRAKNKRAIARMKADQEASAQRHQDIRDGKITAGEAFKKMCGKTEREKLHDKWKEENSN